MCLSGERLALAIAQSSDPFLPPFVELTNNHFLFLVCARLSVCLRLDLLGFAFFFFSSKQTSTQQKMKEALSSSYAGAKGKFVYTVTVNNPYNATEQDIIQLLAANCAEQFHVAKVCACACACACRKA